MQSPPETGMFAAITDTREGPPLTLPRTSGQWIVSETPSFQVAVQTFGDVQVLQDDAQGVDVIVHGQLYDGMSLPRIISSYHDIGASFARACNGSFAILLVDRRGDRVLVASDRLGSKQLHLRRVASRTYFSSKLRHLVTSASAMDRAGVAWYLSNGVVHTDRTVLDEVSRVPRASCCTLSDGGLAVTRYWNHEFTGERGGQSFERLRNELADLLVDVVEKRLGDHEVALLSLSAGDDSRGVLGILCHVLRKAPAETFSYGVAEGIADSDATIARRVSDGCGVPHRFLLSYDGELEDVIDRNARWGDGSANFCDEALAWDTLVSQYQARRPPMFLGETLFDENPAPLASLQELFVAMGLRAFSGLSWLERLLPPGQYGELRDAQAADMAYLERLVAEKGEVPDMEQFLYADQYLCHILLPWRENYAARGFAVQEPFLDNDVLDFTQGLPPEPLGYKSLYRAAATLLAPDVFTEPGPSVSGCDIDWRDQLQRRATALAASCVRDRGSCASLLDDIIDPGVVGAIFRLREMAGVPDVRPREAASRAMRRGWGRVRRKVTGRQPPVRTGPADFLRRYLALRRFLEVSCADSLMTQLQAADRTA